jgi:DNA-binding CsgD family transcriptional regulator
MAESGDLDAGIAEMSGAREQAVEAGAFGVVGRADINLATELESMGRSSEAVAAAVRAVEVAETHGRPDVCGFALGNQAESLYAMGEWAEAARITEEAAAAARSAETRGFAALMKAHLHLGHGDLAALDSAREAARRLLGSHASAVNAAVQLRHFALEVAAGRGDFAGVRAELRAALEAGFPPGTHRYAWPLLHAAAVHEAGVRGLPAAEEGRAEVLEELRTAVRRLPHPAPVWQAHSALVTAEIDRAEGRSSPGAWESVTEAFESLERPYHLALARQRRAEALLEDGAQSRDTRERANGLLAAAHAVAVRLGAQPLRTEIEQLSLRARLPAVATASTGAGAAGADPAAGGAEGAADPASAFGLTQRERDVLHLVAAGRSNRQIAEQLFISPKTASVHVSNILAKLGVGGRGEAAAMAHRLRLLTDADSRPAAG